MTQESSTTKDARSHTWSLRTRCLRLVGYATTVAMGLWGTPVFATAAPAAESAQAGHLNPPAEAPETSPAVASQNLVQRGLAQLADAFLEDKEDIEQIFMRAIALDPHNPGAYAGLARYHLWLLGLGETDLADIYRATQYATQVKDLAPQSPLGDYLLAEILVALGQPDQAQKIAAHAQVVFPRHPDTLVFQTRVWAKSDPQKALQAALAALSQGANIDELSPSVSFALSVLYTGHELAEALERFAAMAPDRWLYHRAAMAYLSEKNSSKYLLNAVNHLQKAISLGNKIESRLQLGLLALRQTHDLALAEHCFNDLIAVLNTQHPRAVQARTISHAQLALAFLEGGKPEKAQQHLTEVFSRYEILGDVIVGLFEELSKKRQSKALAAQVQQLLNQDPSWILGHSIKGQEALQSKDFSGAIHSFDNAILLQPNNDAHYASRAHAHHGAGHYEDALNDFNRSIALNPQVPAYHYNQACVLALLGKHAEALDSLKTALAMNEDYKNLAENDEDLKDLRANATLKTQLVGLGIVPPSPEAAD